MSPDEGLVVKNIELFLKALVITPIVMATGMLLIIMSYLIYPALLLGAVFFGLKIADHEKNNPGEEENEKKYGSRHKK